MTDPTDRIPPRSLDDTQPVKTIPSASPWKIWVGLAGLVLMAVMVLVAMMVLMTLPEKETEPPLAVLVTLELDGDAYPVTTEAQTVGGFLLEQHLSVENGDILSPEPQTQITAGMLIRLERARTISLIVDGMTSILRTTFDSPIDILSLAGQTVNASDRVFIDGIEIPISDLLVWPHSVTEIRIRRAVTVQLVDGDTTVNIDSAGDTVGEVLFEAGIQLFLADTVMPDLSEPVAANMQIIIDRSRPITIIVDGTTVETRINSTTIGEALAEAGILLSGLDYTIPAESTVIQPGISVRVIRVTEEFITEEETLPYEVVYQADNTLELDHRSIVQAGQTGLFQRTWRVRYENGIEISRDMEQETIVRSPNNQVVGYGTQVIIRTVDTPEGPLQYWRKLNMYATSYYPAEFGDGDAYTSIGERLTKGIIGIDPTIIQYRTNLYVPGYGTGMAADTGGPRSTPYWVDLGYDNDNIVGWSGWSEVYVLVPVPSTINYLLPENARGGPIP